MRVRRLVDINATQDALTEMHRNVAGLIAASRLRQIAAKNNQTNVLAANFSIGDFVLVRRTVSCGSAV